MKLTHLLAFITFALTLGAATPAFAVDVLLLNLSCDPTRELLYADEAQEIAAHKAHFSGGGSFDRIYQPRGK